MVDLCQFTKDRAAKTCLRTVAIQQLHRPPGLQTNFCVCLSRLRCTEKTRTTKFSRRTIGFRRKCDQATCGNQYALLPRVAVKRQTDPIASLHVRDPRTKGQDTANTLIADQIWKRRRPVECSLDEEQSL